MENEQHIESFADHWVRLVIFLAKMIQQVKESFGVAETRYRNVEVSTLSNSEGHPVITISKPLHIRSASTHAAKVIALPKLNRRVNASTSR